MMNDGDDKQYQRGKGPKLYKLKRDVIHHPFNHHPPSFNMASNDWKNIFHPLLMFQ